MGHEQRAESVVLCGLPGSGKTSFLAALWHVITSQEIASDLKFDSLPENSEYLVELEREWVSASPIVHTPAGRIYPASINLLGKSGKVVLECPDLSGELWMHAWEDRRVSKEVEDRCNRAAGILFFVHADEYEKGLRISEMLAMARDLGESLPAETSVTQEWQASKCPTQTILVDLLQSLSTHPLGKRGVRVAIILSAWDLALDTQKQPLEYLSDAMPLLGQYLRTNQGGALNWRVFGVSALGGDVATKKGQLLSHARPYQRIIVSDNAMQSNDITKPISWLLEHCT